MVDRYLIVWNDYDSTSVRCKDFTIVGGFNVNDAVVSFYSRHSYEGINENLFYAMIKNFSMEDVIMIHNALAPDYEIVEIYTLTKCLYSAETENEMWN